MAWSASRRRYGQRVEAAGSRIVEGVESDVVMRPDGRLRRGHADAAYRIRRSDGPAAPTPQR